MKPLAAAIIALGLAGGAIGANSGWSGPRLVDLRVDNGGRPYAGDRALLTTLTPNGDGLRERARVSFTLVRPASVKLEVVATDEVRRKQQTLATKTAYFRAGRRHMFWRPPHSLPERTYIVRLTTSDERGRTRVYGAAKPGPGMRQDAPVVRVLGIQAGFRQRSYAPSDLAGFVVRADARSLRFQVFAYGNQSHPTERDLKTSGEAMTPPVTLDWRRYRDAPRFVRFVRAGDWPSGLYFLRMTANDGRVGYAPFILRPRKLGERRIAVVLSTNTWQAYNFDDANGDGWGDSWYISGRVSRINLLRPFLDFGVPRRFKDWDLTFIAWLATTGKQVDYLSDEDLERFANGAALASRYDLVIFPGHAEYVTTHAYDVVTRYRDLGGNLAFLSANNFFWKVIRRGRWLYRVRQWRNLGRPEAGLCGVQYVASDQGGHQAGFLVADVKAAPWLFSGTGLRTGDRFGRYGIEIDQRTKDSPSGTRVLASIPDVMGPGKTAEMTYYEKGGAKVFSAGALNFASTADRPLVSRLLDNLWARLSRP
ncbi:MAG: hypothetical protein M3R70_07460 [Actinomycetota bacterium]|nr:hypothetical protein [Actinomycetota bacterium]